MLFSLDGSSAKLIKNVMALFKNRNIQNNLVYIKCNICFITQSILKLEKVSFLLDKSLEIVENAKFKLSQNKSPIAEKIDKKVLKIPK